MQNEFLDKIKKLLAKAQSTEAAGNLEEAKVFAAKANELMLKYAISEAELEEKTNTSEQAMGTIVVPLAVIQTKKEGDWGLRLFSVIAKANFGSTIYSSYRKEVYIIGLETYTPLIQEIAFSLQKRLRILAKQEAKILYKAGSIANPAAYIRAFLRGAVSGIDSQLQKQREQQTVEYTNLPSIINKHNSSIKNYIAKEFGSTTTRGSRNLSSEQGFIEGKKHGSTISISSGVNLGTTGAMKALN